jgi:hypothetical protein
MTETHALGNNLDDVYSNMKVEERKIEAMKGVSDHLVLADMRTDSQPWRSTPPVFGQQDDETTTLSNSY